MIRAASAADTGAATAGWDAFLDPSHRDAAASVFTADLLPSDSSS